MGMLCVRGGNLAGGSDVGMVFWGPGNLELGNLGQLAPLPRVALPVPGRNFFGTAS
jgi:hypothetical protein